MDGSRAVALRSTKLENLQIKTINNHFKQICFSKPSCWLASVESRPPFLGFPLQEGELHRKQDQQFLVMLL